MAKKKKKKKERTPEQQVKSLERKVRKLDNLVGMGEETMKRLRGDCEELRNIRHELIAQRDEACEQNGKKDKKIDRLLSDYHYAAARLLFLEHEKRKREAPHTFRIEARIHDGKLPDSDGSPTDAEERKE